ncbi:MAG: DUF6364 family protein [Candidatus Limnocylindrales bacterium]
MPRTNLTLQLDTDVIRRARIVAAKRGTSVSALVAHELDALVARDERYEAAERRAIELLGHPKARGGRPWTRDELYADRIGPLTRG